MADEWITEPGETGTVRVVNRADGWYVEKPATDTETKCVLQGAFDIADAEGTQTLEITVSKYMRSGGQGPDYLFASPTDRDADSDATESNTDTERVASSRGTRGTPKRSLSDLSGSGEYVTVEAVVDDVFWVKKDTPNVPDILGVVRDEQSGDEQMFVVNSGVKHPYLEEGRKFVFRNAKDHYYEPKENVQLMITQQTGFTDRGQQASQSKSKSEPESNQQESEKSLQQIAQSLLGDEEFTMNSARDSSVGKAKRKAKRQQRDPAIDPKLNNE